MASIIRAEGERHPLTVGCSVPVSSFGYNYSAEVIELKERTAMIRYTNKGGTVWTLRVKRDDIAAPTAAKKAATERGVKTRTLRNGVMWRKNNLEYATKSAEETLEQINHRREQSRKIAAGYGWKIGAHDAPMTQAEFEIHRAERVAYELRNREELAAAEAALAAHLNTQEN